MSESAPNSDTFSVLAGRYELRDRIGEGGLSAVYEGFDQLLKRRVAVKLMHRDHEQDARSLLQTAWREAMTASSLQHTNIIEVYDFGSENGQGYLVMEYLNGESLEETIQRGPLHMGDFHAFAVQALDGLSAAHEMDIVHRDIKPGNFMLVHDDEIGFRVKILDFGLAKYSQVPRAQSIDNFNALMGSIHYMAPEQFQRLPVDRRTDLYSLGCVFYEALTGHDAFEGGTVTEMVEAHLYRWPHPLRQLRPNASELLENWLAKFLHKEPGVRYDSAAEALFAMPTADQCTAASASIAFPSAD